MHAQLVARMPVETLSILATTAQNLDITVSDLVRKILHKGLPHWQTRGIEAAQRRAEREGRNATKEQVEEAITSLIKAINAGEPLTLRPDEWRTAKGIAMARLLRAIWKSEEIGREYDSIARQFAPPVDRRTPVPGNSVPQPPPESTTRPTARRRQS